MEQEHIEVSTKHGKLKGLVKTSGGLSRTVYYSFQGIPYAKPPVGNLRFKVPQPFGRWEGVRDATKEGNDTVQNHMLFRHPMGEEDCLYLNVYCPQKPGLSTVKRAVMVWIHGGGFSSGSGSTELYGPDFLIEEDVILVTINYRCGVLGFLSLENEKVPGNMGLKDQTLALRWVQEHVSSFGGDPDNVTIFGESAGGASVHYHMLSPLSRGLFHKAILQSGCSFNLWTFQDKPLEVALQLAKELGCAYQDPDHILDFLMTVPAKDILKAKESLATTKDLIQRFSCLFLPCVEVAGDAPFLSDTPRRLMEAGDFAKVPVILGLTDKEGIVAVGIKAILFDEVNADSSLLVPIDLALDAASEEGQSLGKKILKFYTNTDTMSWNSVLGYCDFVSDIAFSIGLEDCRKYFLTHKTTVYSYLFTYISNRGLSSSLTPKAYPDQAQAAQCLGVGASHGDDLVHQFKTNMTQFPFVPPPPEDAQFMAKFLKMWSTFAKTGNPNCEELKVTWQPDSIPAPSFLELGKVFKINNGISFPKRMEFWKDIYGKYSYSY